MVNGAFFVPSGAGVNEMYAKATSIDAKSAYIIDQLTMNAGVFGEQRYMSPIHYETEFETNLSIFSYPLFIMVTQI